MYGCCSADPAREACRESVVLWEEVKEDRNEVTSGAIGFDIRTLHNRIAITCLTFVAGVYVRMRLDSLGGKNNYFFVIFNVI